MIRLSCSRCRHMLEIDAAFAGGVCRCQFCGTIQSVPKRAVAAEPAAAPAMAGLGPVRSRDRGLMLAVAMAAMLALVCAALALALLERAYRAGVDGVWVGIC